MSGYYASPDLDNLWVASTPDDGKTWNTPTKALTRPGGNQVVYSNQGVPKYNTEGFYFQTMAALRTYDDLIFVAVEHINNITEIHGGTVFLNEPDSGARVAMVIMQYNFAGPSQPGQSSVIFKGVKPDFI